MKLPDAPDSRPPAPDRLRMAGWRLGTAIAALLAGLGILLAMAGIATLLGQAPGPGAGFEVPALSAGAALLLLGLGLLLLWSGVRAWRICRHGLHALRHQHLAAQWKKHR